MSTFLERIPTYRKIFHAIFNWRNARRLLLTVAVLVTLWAVFCMEENWRGHRDWVAYKAQLVTQDVPLTLDQLQPPLVPDNQNFAKTPILQLSIQQMEEKMSKVLDWRLVTGKNAKTDFPLDVLMGTSPNLSENLPDIEKALDQPDLLAAMKVYDPILDEFATASRRPFARFTLTLADNVPTLQLNLKDIFRLREFYEVRALEELAHDQTDRAADDVITVLRIAWHLTKAPSLTNQLISCAMVLSIDTVLQDGLLAHRWSDAQLAAFQAELQKLDYVSALQHGLAAQIARSNEAFESLGSGQFTIAGVGSKFLGQVHLFAIYDLLPRGWLDEYRIITIQRSLDLESAIDVKGHAINCTKLKLLDSDSKTRLRSPYEIINAAVTYLPKILEGGAEDTVRVDEVQIACALERYRLAKGAFPGKLEDLIPEFMTKIPGNAATGGPFHYQKQASSGATLDSLHGN